MEGRKGATPQAPLFATQGGQYVVPRTFQRYIWHTVRNKAGLKEFRFHDLRHTCATLLLLANVHPKVVSERLGHANIEITLNTYSHLLPGMQESAVAALSGVFVQLQ
jgi:integrase